MARLAKLLFVLVVVPIGILLMFAVLNALMGPDDTVPATDTGPATTTTATTTRTAATPATTTASPTAGPTTSPTTPPTTEPGQYLNEDYRVPDPNPNPPDLPMPQTVEDLKMYLNTNPLYQQSVAVPVRCDISQIDLTNASKSQLKTHFDQLTACLMRVWGPTLASAGYEAVRPTVTIYSGQVQSACGKLPDENAVYCAGDQQVYYAANLPAIIPYSLRSARFVVDSVVAHEFGHAVQARTGILLSEQYVEQLDTQNGNDAAGNDASRRTEMQADCFAGQFLGSIAQSAGLTPDDEAAIGQLFYSIGDDQLTGDPTIDGNHGWGANRQTWIAAGLSNPRLSTCNTFTADANSVR